MVYNAVVERRARARAEKAFGREHPDVLFEAAGARREPTLGRLPEERAPSRTLGRIAEPDAPPRATARSSSPRRRPAPQSVVSNRIDTVAVVLADDPVTRESLEPLLDALQVAHHAGARRGHRRRAVAADRVARRADSWRELRAGLQLASRSGPVTEEEIATFNETIAELRRRRVSAVSQRESPAAAAARARDLDRFCADADIEVAVNVVGQFGATFALRAREGDRARARPVRDRLRATS